MQFFQSPILSSPLTLYSLLILLCNFSIFANGTPLLTSRDLVCAPDYLSCNSAAGTLYCCPPSTVCAPNDGCIASNLATTTPLLTPTSTAVPNASSTTAGTPKAPKTNKDSPFFTTTMIITISVGGGIALILLAAITFACHRKRQQGRLLLAAYESPNRTPYEVISLKAARSTTSIVPIPTTPAPGTPKTGATFNVPQHTATPPPLYLNGDEKEMFPRQPEPVFKQEMRNSRPVTPNRAVFPVEVLGSPRSSSLPPYSPQQQQQQQTFSPQQAAFPQQQIPFTFTPQSSNTPIHSPPLSPMTPVGNQEMFHPVIQQQQQQPQNGGYPMAY